MAAKRGEGGYYDGDASKGAYRREGPSTEREKSRKEVVEL